MDIGNAFGFVFKDERWLTKVLIGGLLLIIPIVNFAVFGFMLKTAENVARNHPQPLPDWSDFGDLFMRGLYYFVISLVYQIPTILLVCIWGIGLGGLGALAESNEGGEAVGGLAALALCFYPLILVLGLVLGLAAYVATARYIATGTLSEAFKFGDVIALLRNNVGPWIILLLVIILSGIVGQLGAIACGVGVLFTSFYAQCVNGHALGQTMQQVGLGSAGTATTYPTTPYDPPTYQ